LRKIEEGNRGKTTVLRRFRMPLKVNMIEERDAKEFYKTFENAIKIIEKDGYEIKDIKFSVTDEKYVALILYE
jgi:hypothetical protein